MAQIGDQTYKLRGADRADLIGDANQTQGGAGADNIEVTGTSAMSAPARSPAPYRLRRLSPVEGSDLPPALGPIIRNRVAIELWAQDEARIGLVPIVRRVWAHRGERPLARQRRCYEWL